MDAELLEERLAHLSERLDHYKDRLDALEDNRERHEDKKETRHSTRLEWVVVALVFIEALI